MLGLDAQVLLHHGRVLTVWLDYVLRCGHLGWLVLYSGQPGNTNRVSPGMGWGQ